MHHSDPQHPVFCNAWDLQLFHRVAKIKMREWKRNIEVIESALRCLFFLSLRDSNASASTLMDGGHAYLNRLRMARKRAATDSGKIGYHQRPESNMKDTGFWLYLGETTRVPDRS